MFGHCAWARYSRGSNVITVFVHTPTLRIRAGCQCPRCTRSWPSSRELMGTGSTSFLSLRDNVLFCILRYTPFPMTSDRAKLSKYVHSDIGYPRCEQCHFGPVAQHSLVLGTKFEQPLIHWTSNEPHIKFIAEIAETSAVTKNKLLLRKHLNTINNAIEIQSEVLSQCESCIIYNLSLMRVVYHIQSIIDDFCPSLFPDCVFSLPYFEGFYFLLPLIIWSFLLLL